MNNKVVLFVTTLCFGSIYLSESFAISPLPTFSEETSTISIPEEEFITKWNNNITTYQNLSQCDENKKYYGKECLNDLKELNILTEDQTAIIDKAIDIINNETLEEAGAADHYEMCDYICSTDFLDRISFPETRSQVISVLEEFISNCEFLLKDYQEYLDYSKHKPYEIGIKIDAYQDIKYKPLESELYQD